MLSVNMWLIFALGSALFAAMTVILGKMGVARTNSNFATFIQTIVILLVTVGIFSFQKQWQMPENQSLYGAVMLALSGIAKGAALMAV